MKTGPRYLGVDRRGLWVSPSRTIRALAVSLFPAERCAMTFRRMIDQQKRSVARSVPWGRRWDHILWTMSAVLPVACADVGAPDAAGSRRLWKVPSAMLGTPFDPVANREKSMVYFATPDHRMKKLRASDGAVVWDVSAGGPVTIFPTSNSVLSADVVAISKVDIFAFDTLSGAFRWAHRGVDGDQSGYSALVANDSLIFGGGRFGRLYAIDAKLGTNRWVRDLREGSPDDIGTLRPKLSGDLVFVCTQNYSANPARGKLWAVDAFTGIVRWSHAFAPEVNGIGATCFGSPAFWQTLVIQPQSDGRVFAFDRLTGEVRWTAPAVHNKAVSSQTKRLAAVGGNVLIVTNTAVPGMIVAYDPSTGRELWRRSDYGDSLYPPSMDETTAYVDHGWIFAAYDNASGAIRWQTPASLSDPATMLMGTAIISSDRIFIGGRDGSYALRR